jgi:hypothetical protein
VKAAFTRWCCSDHLNRHRRPLSVPLISGFGRGCGHPCSLRLTDSSMIASPPPCVCPAFQHRHTSHFCSAVGPNRFPGFSTFATNHRFIYTVLTLLSAAIYSLDFQSRSAIGPGRFSLESRGFNPIGFGTYGKKRRNRGKCHTNVPGYDIFKGRIRDTYTRCYLAAQNANSPSRSAMSAMEEMLNPLTWSHFS